MVLIFNELSDVQYTMLAWQDLLSIEKVSDFHMKLKYESFAIYLLFKTDFHIWLTSIPPLLRILT